ncbi:MAG: hypothetical protein R6U17_08535, partial [Thermoplasmata archaeon]
MLVYTVFIAFWASITTLVIVNALAPAPITDDERTVARHGEAASLRHGVAGVDHEVHDHLFDLPLVDHNLAKLRGRDVSGLDILPQYALQQIVHSVANPNPEITYEDAMSTRDDLIFATGRSDYPNQVNNVLGFPFIFRGALDVMA